MPKLNNPDTRQIVFIALITAACLLGESTLYVAMPVHYESVGLESLWQVGIILAANRFIRLPLNPFTGWVYGRISENKGIIAAAVLGIITTFGYSMADGFWQWILVRCMWGVAWSFLRIGAFFSLLKYSTDQNRGYLMGLYNGLYRLGSLVGMLFGGFLADLLSLRQATFIFGCITTLIVALLIFCTVRLGGKTPAKQSPGRSNLPVPVEKRSWRSAIRAFCCVDTLYAMLTGALIALVFQGVVTASLSQLIHAHFGAGVVLAGVTLGAASCAGIIQAVRWSWEPVAAPFFGRISDRRFSRQSVLCVCLLVAAGSGFLVTLPLHFWLWLPAILLLQLMGSALTTVGDSVASDAASRHASGKSFMLTYSLAVDVGASIGPVVTYAVMARYGIDLVFTGVSGLFVLLALAWYARCRKRYFF